MWKMILRLSFKSYLPRTRAALSRFAGHSEALAAVEFSLILPIMLVLFFGTVEVSNGIAAYRNVTIMAHTLADLTTQSVSVQDADLTNFFAASNSIMSPYPTSTISQTITEVWVNPALQARVQWSSGPAALTAGTVVTIPTGLSVANSYVIFSQVSYKYIPVVGYVMSKAGVTLSDFAYTRPRLSACVLYNGQSSCPQS